MKGAGGKLRTIILMVALVTAACDRSAPEPSRIEARLSFCADFLDIVVNRSDRGADLGARLKKGARELARAEDSLARTVNRVAEALAQDPIEGVRMSVYLADGARAAQRVAYERRIAELSTSEPTFVSSRQARRELVDRNSDRPELWENLSVRALPASYRLILGPNTDPDALVTELEGFGGVDQVRVSDPLAAIEETTELLDACAPLAAAG